LRNTLLDDGRGMSKTAQNLFIASFIALFLELSLIRFLPWWSRERGF